MQQTRLGTEKKRVFFLVGENARVYSLDTFRFRLLQTKQRKHESTVDFYTFDQSQKTGFVQCYRIVNHVEPIQNPDRLKSQNQNLYN